MTIQRRQFAEPEQPLMREVWSKRSQVRDESMHGINEWFVEIRRHRRRSRRVLERVHLSLHRESRCRVPKFHMARSYDTAESQHLEGLAFLPFTVDVCLEVVKPHLVTPMTVELMMSIQAVRRQIHRMLLNSVSTLSGRLHRRHRTNKLASSDGLAVSKIS